MVKRLTLKMRIYIILCLWIRISTLPASRRDLPPNYLEARWLGGRPPVNLAYTTYTTYGRVARGPEDLHLRTSFVRLFRIAVDDYKDLNGGQKL